ncbi:MAG: sulfatase-like hydrolase/transferase [candidate division Zixibacteria bacterium]|nr:sulfatase-like hydrolase/transferase [candidate division Zixibacteria bacterium]
MKDWFVLHPYLFGLFPILFLYTQNAGELELSETILPVALMALCVTILTLLFRLALRNAHAAGIMVTVLLLWFFSFGHLVKLLPDFDIALGLLAAGPDLLLLVVGGGCLLAVYCYLRLTRQSLSGVSSVLNVIGLLLIAGQVVQGGYVWATRPSVEHTWENATTVSCHTSQRPDVYYIIVDGYARADVLADMYDYDNRPFIDFLRRKGFHVADSGYSNYCQTVLSLAATLNMDYLDQLGEFDRASDDRLPLAERLWYNRVFAIFADMGYSTVAFGSGYSYTEFRDADYYLASSRWASEFQNVLVSTTPLPLLLGRSRSPYAMHRERISFILDNIADAGADRSPKFVFAHIIAPHPPFVFDAEGNPVQSDRPFTLQDASHLVNNGIAVEEYVTGYTNQVTYVNSRLEAVVERLLAKSPENPPIIIIQGDHGPGSEFSWVGSASTNLLERFSILNAVYLPGVAADPLYAGVSSVNTFRIVLNRCFGTTLDLLPDRSFYTTWEHPYDFELITRPDGNGIYSSLQECYLARSPDRVAYWQIREPKRQGLQHGDEGFISVDRGGLNIELDREYHASLVEISVDNDDDYEILFRLGDSVVARHTLTAAPAGPAGLRVDTVNVPGDASRTGFDGILIVPYGGDEVYGIGHIRLGNPHRP